MTSHFVYDYVFNLSQKTLSPLEIKVLEKGLEFSPTPSSINEVDLRRVISDFTRKMRCKWFFRNERQENVSETSEFKSKSTWNPPKGAPALELFLSQTEKDILSILPGKATNYNLSKEEYLTMRSLQNDRSVVIKPADKGSAVVVWDRNDYLKEAERQLSDEKTYEEIRITEKDQVELVEKSNDLFSNLRRKNVITENENNYFRFNFKKATNLGKLYLLPKMKIIIIKKYLQKIWVKWLTSFLKTTCLSSILSFINKYQEQLLERSLPLFMLVSLWTTFKRNF